MALFRRLFYRKPPDRLLEITDRVYGNALLAPYCVTTSKTWNILSCLGSFFGEFGGKLRVSFLVIV